MQLSGKEIREKREKREKRKESDAMPNSDELDRRRSERKVNNKQAKKGNIHVTYESLVRGTCTCNGFLLLPPPLPSLLPHQSTSIKIGCLTFCHIPPTTKTQLPKRIIVLLLLLPLYFSAQTKSV